MSTTPTQHSAQHSRQNTMSTQEKLRRARRDAGLTQGMAARISGLNRNTISRYESTERKFKDSIINRLAETYDEDPGWLLEQEGINIKPNRMIQIQDTPAAQALMDIQDEITETDVDLIVKYIQFVQTMHPPTRRRTKRPTVKVRLTNISAIIFQIEANLSEENIRRIARFMNFRAGREAALQKPTRRPGVQNGKHTGVHPSPHAHLNGNPGHNGHSPGHDSNPKS